MSKRVSPTERLRAEIDEVFAGGEDLSRAIERVAQLGAQLLLQSAVEAEVAAFLGRDRYERAASCGDPHPGPTSAVRRHISGYREANVLVGALRSRRKREIL